MRKIYQVALFAITYISSLSAMERPAVEACASPEQVSCPEGVNSECRSGAINDRFVQSIATKLETQIDDGEDRSSQMNSTTLFLIRHGQTDWNQAGKLQGHADVPLNGQGIEQAKKVAQFLEKKQAYLAALYSSDLQRAHRTAQEISQLFDIEIIVASDLREGHYGKLEGLTKKEYYDLYGPWNFAKLPEGVDAEPRDKVVARVMNYLLTIVQKHKGKHVAVVTHGGVLGSLLTHLGYKVEGPGLTNVSITTLRWHADQGVFLLESIESV